MTSYIIRRLLLLPITLFFVILINFVIINLAPGDPVTVVDISKDTGAQNSKNLAFGSDDRYLVFREFYGLTLPVLFNTWIFTTKDSVEKNLEIIATKKLNKNDLTEISHSQYQSLRTEMGDKARYVLPALLEIIENKDQEIKVRQLALRFFQRGVYRNAYIGPDLSPEQYAYNDELSSATNSLNLILASFPETQMQMDEKVPLIKNWFEQNKNFYQVNPSSLEKVKIFFFETRFFRYMSRVFTLDFGTLRSDPNKTVIYEVVKRFKYSLTLSVLPMFITFFLCLFFGFLMAVKQDQWQDNLLNVIFLILYAIPIFVVAPFLIEKIGLKYHFPFTDIPIPISGFTSSDKIYNNQISYQRLFDVLQHIFLPLIAVTYGMLAVQSRLSRTAVLEVLRQDYVRTARAKGASFWNILVKHVGRNASITIITSIAGSLGVVLGGSLIVETLFEINGFGKFFYDAVVNRDYNVIMFSALAGSFLTLLGYLVADIAYTLLDPRITLD